jgi:hypothetical protein
MEIRYNNTYLRAYRELIVWSVTDGQALTSSRRRQSWSRFKMMIGWHEIHSTARKMHGDPYDWRNLRSACRNLLPSTTVHKLSTSDKFAFLMAIRIIQTSINKNTGTIVIYMKDMQI